MRLSFILAVCLTTVTAATATGQRSREREDEAARRIATTIVLDSAVVGEDSVLITRSTHGPERDIVRVRPGVSGRALVQALLTLNAQRQFEGDTARSSSSIRSRTSGSSRTRGAEDVHADDIIRRLATAPARMIPGVGRYRAITIYMPSGAMRQSGKFGQFRRKSDP